MFEKAVAHLKTFAEAKLDAHIDRVMKKMRGAEARRERDRLRKQRERAEMKQKMLAGVAGGEKTT